MDKAFLVAKSLLNYAKLKSILTNPGGHAVWTEDARTLESRVRNRQKAWMFVLCLLCFVQVTASVTGWSLIQRSRTVCVCVCVCVCVSNCVWSIKLKNEEAYARDGLLRHRKKINSLLPENYTSLKPTHLSLIFPIYPPYLRAFITLYLKPAIF